MNPSQFNAPNKGPDSFSGISIEKQIRNLQIIRAALIFGVIVFMALVLGVLSGIPKKLEFGLFEIVLALILVQTFVVYLFAPKFVKVSQENQDSIRKMTGGDKDVALMNLVMPAEIIRGAVIEGATFFALVLVLVANSQVGLFVGAFLIALAIAVFPTTGRIRSRVEDLRYRLGV